jgi:hypothetical protein
MALNLLAVAPEHLVSGGAVPLKGVGPDNPVLYDNDWWFDVFDNNCLWAQASLGKVNLRGNIVSRDMWDWQKGYQYSFEQSWKDAEKALKLARDSSLKYIPDLTRGSDRVLIRPESGRIEDTVPHPSDGSRLVIPKTGTDLPRCREEFFRVLRNPAAYQVGQAADAPTSQTGLSVTALGKRYAPDPRRVVVQQAHADPGGSTSIRNTDRAHLAWKTNGYFQRNRDLGQVFTAPRDFQLNALVLRTGPSDAAVLAGVPGAKVFVQFFGVSGEPRLHDNGTPPGTDARHGFSKNHRCDDYLTGVEYRPVCVVNGGTFPALPASRDLDGRPTGNEAGRLVYLHWQFAGEARLKFQAGKRYAFLVGCEEPSRARGFTLANVNAAGVNAPPSLTGAHDRYHGGWGLRREGDGTLPPTMFPGAQPPDDSAQLGRLHREALFAEGPSRYSLSPTTDGFPDVDTYRDLEFYLETDVSTPESSRETNETIHKP